jgi:O-antigen ligase
MILCLPLNLGAFYTHLMEEDLIFAFDVILFALYILWIVERWELRKHPMVWGKITLPFILLMFWTGLSALNAISLTMWGMGMYMAIKAYMVYLYIINKITTKEELVWFIRWLAAGVAFQGFLGIVQYTTGSSLGLEFLGAVAKQRLSAVTRVRGTIGYPNQFGAWLALQIPIAVSLFIFELGTRKKLFYGGTAVLGIFGLLLSFSRSAWAGLLGSGLVFLLILARKRLLKARYVLTIGLAMAFVGVLLVVFWDTIMLRFETGDTGKYRLIMMEIAYDLIKENPLFGVGLNNYNFHQVELFRYWNPVHNEYMRLAAETGIPGLIFFMVIAIMCLKESYKMLQARDRFIFAVALGSLCSMWAFLFLVNFGPEYSHYRVQFLFWIVLGIITALRRIYRHTLNAHAARQQTKLSRKPIETVSPQNRVTPSYPHPEASGRGVRP